MAYILILVLVLAVAIFGFRNRSRDKDLYGNKKIDAPKWAKILYWGGYKQSDGFTKVKLSSGAEFSISHDMLSPKVNIQQISGGNMNGDFRKLGGQDFEIELGGTYHIANNTLEIKGVLYTVGVDFVRRGNRDIAKVHTITDGYTDITYMTEELNSEELLVLSLAVAFLKFV